MVVFQDFLLSYWVKRSLFWGDYRACGMNLERHLEVSLAEVVHKKDYTGDTWDHRPISFSQFQVNN